MYNVIIVSSSVHGIYVFNFESYSNHNYFHFFYKYEKNCAVPF